MGGRQRRRVVEAVADHQHAAARGFERVERRDLVCRLQGGLPIGNSECRRDRRHRFRSIA